MADNVTIEPNYRAVCASDELADGSQAQIVKIANATDGDGTLVTPLTDTALRASDLKVTLDSEEVAVKAGTGDLKVTLDGENPVVKFLGTDDVAYKFKVADGRPRVSSMPYGYEVAEGNITGHAAWSKSGFNADVDVGDEDLWLGGGICPLPAAAATFTVVSDSTDDDGDPVGTGARTVTVAYLDGTYEEKSATVTMNGTGAVTVAADIFRVQTFRVATAGATNAAVGTLTLASGGVTYSVISPGFTRARNSLWTVPARKALYITQVMVSSGNTAKPVRMWLRATYDDAAAAVRTFYLPYLEMMTNDNVESLNLDVPMKFPAQTTVKLSAYSYANNAIASGTMRGWVETA